MYDRVDNYWDKVFGIQTATGDKKFNLLPRVVKSVLCIHHGNADVDRTLSDNKNIVTDERTRLSEFIIHGLRLAKDFFHAHDGDVSKVMITKEMVEAGRNAHRTYKRRPDEEKEEAEQRKTLKLADIAEARVREEEKKEVNKEKRQIEEKEKSPKNFRDCTEGRNESCRTIDCRRQQKVGQSYCKEGLHRSSCCISFD